MAAKNRVSKVKSVVQDQQPPIAPELPAMQQPVNEQEIFTAIGQFMMRVNMNAQEIPAWSTCMNFINDKIEGK